jgi:HAD superfamily hydrolase (TIGR01459 family)
MTSSSLTQPIAGLKAIAGDYDVLICDVWGVLHDGKDPFARAIDALQRFRAGVGPVVLLSNAPRLADGVKAQFARIGVPDDCYDAIITSGMATREELKRRAREKKLPIYYLGPDRDLKAYDGLNLVRVGAKEAELVLCVGPVDDESETAEDYRGLLEQFRARAIPMLCANPDLVVQRGAKIVYCAGAIARLYEDMGGQAIYFGKPHPQIFETARAEARRFSPALRPLVVGDGVATDILGANRLGWDALFIVSGLYGDAGDSPERLRELFAANSVHARAVMTALSW